MTANPTKLLLPEPGQALAGRDEPIDIENRHFVHSRPIQGPFNEIVGDCDQVLLGLGCFWGAERKFWQTQGVYTTAVGYAGGVTPNPSYEEVCSGLTGHTEVVLVVFQPSIIGFNEILQLFFESHDPTQGMRQGNDLGTQYRSAIYTYDQSQELAAKEAARKFQQALSKAGYPAITTEIREAGEFYYAEPYHQQYLAKNPNGYCGIGGTGVTCIV